MLMPGPSSTATSSARVSRPSASPTDPTSSTSQEEPRAEAVGKQVAGLLPAMPPWSAASGCLRRPCGPSATITAGMPSRSTGAVCQKSDPRHSEAFSSSVSSATSAVTSWISTMGRP